MQHGCVSEIASFRSRGVLCLKHGGFDERLDGILTRAALRLQERMRLAYFRGELISYLEKLGLTEEIDEEVLARESLLELQDEAVLALVKKIRYARKQGYLRAYLEQVNMLELLYLEKERERGSKRLKSVPRRSGAGGEKKASDQADRERELRLQRFKLIK